MVAERVAQLVHIAAEGMTLEGLLVIPAMAQGLVLFAHGSGSSRHSPRHTYVAQILQRGGFGTLLLSLETPAEAGAYGPRFDIDLWATRLIAATHWLQAHPPAQDLTLGYFGAGTGAAVALTAAAALGPVIRALVSRGGRLDLAGAAVAQVQAPTLLLVGSLDAVVLAFNQRAYARLTAEKQLIIIPAATHLFVEPGALQEVAWRAAQWFARYLWPQPAPSS
jgi:alpha-beta hydrolase superfamily lysophospholipase